MQEPGSEKSLKRKALNLFIIAHVVMMGIWGLPGSNFRAATAHWFEPYVIYWGLWHSWDMFSPDPLSLNFNLKADITFADGSKRTWEFPRMEQLGYWKKFEMERYRKWRERVRQDAYSVIWDDTCRWIARRYKDKTNPPVRVVLTREWGQIPPPAPGDYQPIPKSYVLPFNYAFKTYEVKPEDLL
jgi:hypothetical protein